MGTFLFVMKIWAALNAALLIALYVGRRPGTYWWRRPVDSKGSLQ